MAGRQDTVLPKMKTLESANEVTSHICVFATKSGQFVRFFDMLGKIQFWRLRCMQIISATMKFPSLSHTSAFLQYKKPGPQRRRQALEECVSQQEGYWPR